MRELKHPNVAKLHGVAAQSEPLMIVMELVRDTQRVRATRCGRQASPLDSFLKTHKVVLSTKLEMALQVSEPRRVAHKRCVFYRRRGLSSTCTTRTSSIAISPRATASTAMEK